MTEEKKIYCGSGTEKFDGDLIEISVNLTVCGEQKDLFFTDQKGNKWLRLKVFRRKAGADEYGRTHGVAVDTWKPNKEANKLPNKENDDLPF